MRRLLLLAGLPLLLSSAPPPVPGETIGASLARARAESRDAEERAARLEHAAAAAVNEEARLRAERLAAAAAIEAAEADIDLASATLDRARAALSLQQARLAKARAPVAALLAGIVTMARQPPLLALADGGSVEELVRVRALLDSTMPLVERRSAALRAEVAAGQHLAAVAGAARANLDSKRRQLGERQQRLAALERQAGQRGQQFASAALGQEDRVLAAGEDVASLGGEALAQRAALANARHVAALGLSPPRPIAGDSHPMPSPIAYSLPSPAAVLAGLGSVNASGVSARGLRLATAKGARLIVPADGTILFAGPFRDQDGVIIIDHGRGWTSLLLGAATDLAKGSRVRRGQLLGRALGELTVELREKGQPRSAALIAGSSPALSNGDEFR